MFYHRLGQHIGRGRSKNHYYKDCFKLVKKFQRKFIIFYAIWKLIFHYRTHSITNRNKIKKTFVDYLLYLIPKKSGSNCPRVWVCNKSNTTSAKCGTGTAYPSEESKFTTGFQIGSCRSIFNVMSCVTLLILLSLFLQTLRCLSIDLRSLITTLISSNFFFTEDYIQYFSNQKFELLRLFVLSFLQCFVPIGLFGIVYVRQYQTMIDRGLPTMSPNQPTYRSFREDIDDKQRTLIDDNSSCDRLC